MLVARLRYLKAMDNKAGSAVRLWVSPQQKRTGGWAPLCLVGAPKSTHCMIIDPRASPPPAPGDVAGARTASVRRSSPTLGVSQSGVRRPSTNTVRIRAFSILVLAVITTTAAEKY